MPIGNICNGISFRRDDSVLRSFSGAVMVSFTRGIDGLGDVTVDGSIDVNNSPDPEGGDTSGGGDEAVVALSIVLALVLLAIIAGLVYYKRR